MNKHLLALDFDNTVALSFKDSPNGMNVNVASRNAVRDVFGDEGSSVYENIGGLQGREPGELVGLILDGTGQGGFSLEVATEQYVVSKLSYLDEEIGPDWPRLTPGAKEFFQSVAYGDIPVDIAIVSSGHDSFISRVFEVNGIAPQILVTSDILRRRGVEGKHKPHPYQLAEAHRQWMRRRLNGELMSLGISNGFKERGQLKANMAYVGDDPIKDGQMAEQSRIPFIFVPFVNKTFIPDKDKGQIRVSDFFEIKRNLLRNVGELRRGVSFAEILFGRKDTELFPPVLEEQRPWARMMRERA